MRIADSTEPVSDHAFAGAVSGFVTRFVCQPLDVVKIRFQLQVEPIRNERVSKYRSVLQAFALIIREEGVAALWKGHVAAQLLSVVYGTTQFYSYNAILRSLLKLSPTEEWKRPMQFAAGAGAGGIATVVSFPFDTIRTRLVAQSANHRVYRGIYHCCSSILRDESAKALFYGLSPTFLQVIPHTGVVFALYGLFTDTFKAYSRETDTGIYNSMISGSVAGLLGKTAVYPFDLARKRLQIQGFEHGRKGFGKFFKCDGLVDCVRVTLKEEGARGLFKGLMPSQLKAAFTTALHFTVYEQTLLLLRLLH